MNTLTIHYYHLALPSIFFFLSIDSFPFLLVAPFWLSHLIILCRSYLVRESCYEFVIILTQQVFSRVKDQSLALQRTRALHLVRKISTTEANLHPKFHEVYFITYNLVLRGNEKRKILCTSKEESLLKHLRPSSLFNKGCTLEILFNQRFYC